MARVRGAEGFSATLGPDSHRGFRRKRTEQDQASPGVATELCPGNRHDKGTPDPCLKWDFQVYLRNDGAVLNIDLDRCAGKLAHSATQTRAEWHTKRLR